MELRRRMGELLDRASAGERIVVERDRRPLAVLVPYEDALRLDDSVEEARTRALAALDRLEAIARRTLAEYPEPPDLPYAAELVRHERSSGHGFVG